MINKSMSWKDEAGRPFPFLLKPQGKDYLWGGTRLNDDFSKGINLAPLAETWECSTHPDGPSTVASGPFAGRLLPEVLKDHPEYLGTHPRAEKGQLPILIKLIDACQDLSVQVHPNDAYAAEHENGSLGKTEMWYVLDARKGTHLVYGFYHDMDRETLKKGLLEGTVEKYLQRVAVRKDDVFFVEPGTVHGIGAGSLIAEIQESSNITYRLYDYNRVDKNGQPRQLHVEQALQVADLKGRAEPRQPMRMLRYRPGYASELLCRCKYFQVERMLVNTERCRKMMDFQTEANSFQVLLCIGGCGVMADAGKAGEPLNFFRGDCIFVPASCTPLKIHGRAQFLKVSC